VAIQCEDIFLVRVEPFELLDFEFVLLEHGLKDQIPEPLRQIGRIRTQIRHLLKEFVDTLEDPPFFLCENPRHNSGQVRVNRLSLFLNDAIQRVVHDIVCSGCCLLDEPCQGLEVGLWFHIFFVLA